MILPFVTHAMSPPEYGAASILSTTSVLLTVVVATPLIQLIVRAGARSDHDGPALLRVAGMYCYLVLPVVVAFVAGIFALAVHEALGIPGFIWAIELLAIGFQPATFTFAMWVSRARQDLSRFVWLSSVSVFATAVTKLVFVVGLHWGVAGWAVSDLLSAVVSAALAVALVRLPKVRPNSSHIRHAVKFTLPLIPHSASLWALTSLSRPVMASVSSLEQVGLLSFGINLAMVAGIIVMEANAALLPHYAREVFPAPTSETLGAVRWQLLGALIAPAVIGCGVAATGRWLFDEAYWSSFFLTGVLLVGQSACGFYLIPMNYLTQTAGLSKFSALASVAGATVILVGILIAGRSYGAIGVAYATTAGYTTMAVVALALTKTHRLDIAWRSWLPYWKEISLAAAAFAASLAALSFSALSWFFLVVCVATAIAAVFIAFSA